MPTAISIALCTYNGAKHLRAQLESILCQTRLPDEIVVCDDASTDGTVELLQKTLSPFRGKLTLHINPHNLGFKENFVQAISLCTGDIICLSDQDDVWEKEKIALLSEALADHPQAQLAFHDAKLVDSQLQLLFPSFWTTMNPAFAPAAFSAGDYSRLFYANVVQGAACALRRELVEAALPFPEEALHDEWLALVATAKGGLIPISAPLLQYRQDNNTLGGMPTSLSEKLVKWSGHLKCSAQTHYDRLQHQAAVLKAFQKRYDGALDAGIAKALDCQLQNFTIRLHLIEGGLLSCLPSHSFCQTSPKEYLKDILAATLLHNQSARRTC